MWCRTSAFSKPAFDSDDVYLKVFDLQSKVLSSISDDYEWIWYWHVIQGPWKISTTLVEFSLFLYRLPGSIKSPNPNLKSKSLQRMKLRARTTLTLPTPTQKIVLLKAINLQTKTQKLKMLPKTIKLGTTPKARERKWLMSNPKVMMNYDGASFFFRQCM